MHAGSLLNSGKKPIQARKPSAKMTHSQKIRSPYINGYPLKRHIAKAAELTPEMNHKDRLPRAKTRKKLEEPIGQVPKPTRKPTKDNKAIVQEALTPITDPNNQKTSSHRQLYVLTFLNALLPQIGGSTLFVRKPEGTLHAGMINLPGGKVRRGEKPHEAAVRELFEETGVKGSFPQYCGALRDSEGRWDVLIYSVRLDPGQEIQTHYIHRHPGTLCSHRPHECFFSPIHNPDLVKDMLGELPLILGLAAAGTRGWTIYAPAGIVKPHEFESRIRFHHFTAAPEARHMPPSDVGVAR